MKKITDTLLVLIGIFVIVSGCSAKMVHIKDEKTEVFVLEPHIAHAKVLWKRNVGSRIAAIQDKMFLIPLQSEVFASGSVLVQTGRNQVQKLNMITGEVEGTYGWRSLHVSPAVADLRSAVMVGDSLCFVIRTVDEKKNALVCAEDANPKWVFFERNKIVLVGNNLVTFEKDRVVVSDLTAPETPVVLLHLTRDDHVHDILIENGYLFLLLEERRSFSIHKYSLDTKERLFRQSYDKPLRSYANIRFRLLGMDALVIAEYAQADKNLHFAVSAFDKETGNMLWSKKDSILHFVAQGVKDKVAVQSLSEKGKSVSTVGVLNGDILKTYPLEDSVTGIFQMEKGILLHTSTSQGGIDPRPAHITHNYIVDNTNPVAKIAGSGLLMLLSRGNAPLLLNKAAYVGGVVYPDRESIAFQNIHFFGENDADSWGNKTLEGSQVSAPLAWGNTLVYGNSLKITDVQWEHNNRGAYALSTLSTNELSSYFPTHSVVVDTGTGNTLFTAMVTGTQFPFFENIWTYEDVILMKTVSGWLYAITREEP